jgi:alanine racemase
LTIRAAIWRGHVAKMVNDVDGLVPVVKGNGYGFGRVWLAALAAEFCDTVAVGTVHELAGIPDALTAVVLTPTLTAPESTRPILTVGNDDHIAALAGWDGRVIVKLVSEMRRFGGDPGLVDRADSAGLDVRGVSVHPPLAGSMRSHAGAITSAIASVDPSLPVWVSHLDVEAYRSLPAGRHYRLRLGTSLWHGDKSALHLSADVLDVRPVNAGDTAGYRLGAVPADGVLVMIGAGTANGVTALPDGRSPFHFASRRLTLHEPPHMHTSMTFIPADDQPPTIGDRVDVQRPLHMTTVDEFEWL